MSDNQLDRAVGFLQGMLNAAAADAKETAGTCSSREKVSVSPDPMLPGFVPDEPPAAAPEEITAAEPPPTSPVVSAKIADDGSKGKRYIATASIAVLTGLAIVAAHKLIVPRTIVREVEKEVQVEPDGIPLELLPDTADPDLWDTVASMQGKLGGAPIRFKRGLSSVNGTPCRVLLDFCRVDAKIYARIAVGNTHYVVVLDSTGTINKIYPAPKGHKPLKDLFGR